VQRLRKFGQQYAIDLTLSAALAGAGLLLYILTLAPTVLEGDSGEFQALLCTLGIVHTTGYPLYTLVGHVFTWLPLGDVAWRVNLFSAVAVALSVPLVYLIAKRVTVVLRPPYARIAAALTAATYAVGYSVWSQAVVASVYGLNVLFVAGVLYLAWRWSETLSQVGGGPGWGQADRWFLALAFFYGLSLTHHRTMLLWGPGLLVFVFWTRPGLLRRCRLLVKAGILCLLPLLLYLYIPLRAWQLHDTRVLGGLLPWITGSDFGGHLIAGLLQMDVTAQLTRYMDLLVRQYTWIGVGLGLVGLAGLIWCRAQPDAQRTGTSYNRIETPYNRAGTAYDSIEAPYDGPEAPYNRAGPDQRACTRFVILTGLPFLLLSVFALAYRYGDPAQATYNLHVYLLPAYLVWVLWMGAGVARLAAYLVEPGLSVLLALLPAFLAFTTYPAVDMSRNDTVARYAWSVLALPFEPQAVVFGEWDHITPLWYLQQVERRRPDLTIVDAPYLSRDWTTYIAGQAAADRPIYFYRGPTRTDARYDVEPFGPEGYSYTARTDRPFRQVSVPGLTRLVPAAHDGQPVHPVAFDFAGRVTLVGYEVKPSPGDVATSPTPGEEPGVRADQPLPVALYWRAGPHLDADYRVSLRLLDQADRVVAQMDKPADDFYDYRYPMTHWPADQTIRDRYQLDPETGTPPGTYTLEVRVYGDAGDLPLSDGPGPAARIGQVTLAPPVYALARTDVQPAHLLDQAVTPDLHVFGYDLEPAEGLPGRPVFVTVYWQAQLTPPTDVLVSLGVVAVSGEVVTSTVPGHPCGGAYPTSRWRPGEVVRDTYRLDLPPDLPNRSYVLAVRAALSGSERTVTLGPLPVYLRVRRFDAPPISNPLSLRLGDGVELLGYGILYVGTPPAMAYIYTGTAPFRGPIYTGTIPITMAGAYFQIGPPTVHCQVALYWRCRAPLDASYKAFVHLVDPAGLIRGQDDSVPCDGACPTNSWVPGEVLVDRYDIILPADAPPGQYHLAVGMYDARTGQRLPVTDAQGTSLGDQILVGPIEVVP